MTKRLPMKRLQLRWEEQPGFSYVFWASHRHPKYSHWLSQPWKTLGGWNSLLTGGVSAGPIWKWQDQCAGACALPWLVTSKCYLGGWKAMRYYNITRRWNNRPYIHGLGVVRNEFGVACCCKYNLDVSSQTAPGWIQHIPWDFPSVFDKTW